MKKTVAVLLLVLMCLSVLPACTPQKEQSGLSIVTTIFPEYDWVRQILGDCVADADLKMLLDTGVDLHSYQPTAADLVAIAQCDLFIYVGGESDEWVEDALKQSVNPDRVVLCLMALLGDAVKEEEEEEGETEYDEHIWLSLRNASLLTEKIAEELAEIDRENATYYLANAKTYQERLNTLDQEFTSACAEASYSTLLFADRFPFLYLTDDYNLNYYAAFKGCSAESEASFETVAFLANQLKTLNLPAVITLEGSDGKIAQTVIETAGLTDIKVLTLNSMQSVTKSAVEAGADYLTIMKENLETLKQAIN